jgi:hypothetical protein
VDPLAVQAASRPSPNRPSVDPQADLAAVLRQGRVLAGEVLAALDGGSLLIGVGAHRVPAKGNVRLELGQRFLFQVEMESGAPVLAVLEEPEGTELEPRLLAALRSVAGGSGSLARVLAELLQALRQGTLGGRGEARAGAVEHELARHERELARHVFVPGSPGDPAANGEALARAVARSGIGYERRLGEAALASLGPRGQAALGGELLEQLRMKLGLAGLDPARFEASLRAALAGSAPGGAAELAAALREAILALGLEAGAREPLLQNLGRLLGDGFLRGPEGALLRAWLAPANRPQDLSSAPHASESTLRALLAEADLDLKAQLLRARSELSGEPLRAGAARVLEALESEQLLNLARARAGDALHWCLPVQDGERWTTAHLYVKPDAGQSRPAGGERTHRLALAVDFQHTGPLRAELAVAPASVAVRIAVARADVLELMRRRQGELAAHLAHGGRRVSLALGLAPSGAELFEGGLAEIRYLDEHHLLDRNG